MRRPNRVEFTDPASLQPILRAAERRVAILENEIIRSYKIGGSPRVARARVYEMLDEFRGDVEGEEGIYDASDERAFGALDFADRKLRQAQVDAVQGRLFPLGERERSRPAILDREDLARRSVVHAERDRAHRAEWDERQQREDSARRLAIEDRKRATDFVYRAMKLDVITSVRRARDDDHSADRYMFEGILLSESGWAERVVRDDALRHRMQTAVANADLQRAARMRDLTASLNAEEAAQKRARSARPIPKGYKIEKSGSGWFVEAPDGRIHGGRRGRSAIATKGAALDWAIADAKTRGR